jgi:hypothetical protein
MPFAMSVTVPMRPIGMRVSACWAFSSTVPKLDTERHTPILGV